MFVIAVPVSMPIPIVNRDELLPTDFLFSNLMQSLDFLSSHTRHTLHLPTANEKKDVWLSGSGKESHDNSNLNSARCSLQWLQMRAPADYLMGGSGNHTHGPLKLPSGVGAFSKAIVQS